MKRFITIICAMLLFSYSTLGEEEYIKGKVLQIERVFAPEEGEEEIKEIKQLRVRILSGSLKGRIVPIDFQVFNEEAYNITLKEGDSVVIYYENIDEYENFTIIEIDKRNYIFYLVGIFVALTLIFARNKGVRGIIALLVVIVTIYGFFIPFIINGLSIGPKTFHSPILGSVVTASISSVVTIFLMTNFNRKGLIAAVGSIGGVVVAGVLSFFFVYKMRLTGYTNTEILNYAVSFSEQVKNIDFREIISAGVIIGSMGAVMDVGMSISSALNEIHEKKPDISAKELFISGMNIGSDVIGTMVNTLVLAYIGSGLASNILLTLQKDQYPMIRIFNFENIVVDILRAFCGSIGILVAVPLTSYVGARLYAKKSSNQ